MKRSRRPIACACVLLSAACASAQTTVFEEKFFGFGDPLDGKTPDTTTDAQAWQAGPVWGDDGIHFSPTVGMQSAYLGFTPEPGRVYTLSTRVRSSHPNAFGFGYLPADLDPAADSHATAPAYAWIAVANSLDQDQQGFLGPGSALPQPWNGDVADPTQYVDLDILLNTDGPNWTVQWLINGQPQGTPVAFATPGNPGIGGVGMSRDTDPNSSGSFVETSYFRLTYMAVPEPGTMAVLALGGWMLISRRRSGIIQ